MSDTSAVGGMANAAGDGAAGVNGSEGQHASPPRNQRRVHGKYLPQVMLKRVAKGISRRRARDLEEGEKDFDRRRHADNDGYRFQTLRLRMMLEQCKSPVLMTRLVMMTLLVIITVFLSVGTFYVTRNNYSSAIGNLSDRLRQEILGKVQENVETILQKTHGIAISTSSALGDMLGNRTGFTQSQMERQVYPLIWSAFKPVQGAVSTLAYAQLDGIIITFQSAPMLRIIFTNVSTSGPTEYYQGYYQLINNQTGVPVGSATPIPTKFSISDLGGADTVLSLLKEPPLTVKWSLTFVLGLPLLNTFLVTRNKNGEPTGIVVITTTVTLISSFMKLVKLPGSSIFIGSENGSLIAASSDISPYEDPHTIVTGFISTTNVSNPEIADAASLLENRFGLGNLTTSAYSLSHAKVAGKSSYINSIPVGIDNLHLYIAITLSRASIMGNVDRKGHATLIILAIVASVVLLVGSVVIIVITLYVSVKMTPTIELQRQKEETQRAQAASEVKSQFLANISHDLRTPMAGILGLLDIMLCDRLTSEQGANLRQMKSCATSLLGLLNNLLDLAKVEAGKLQLECLEFDMVGELESLVDLFSVQSLAFKTELALDLSDDFERTVKGDPSKVRQVFANLLSNACKFTKEGHVLIRGWTKKQAASQGTGGLHSIPSAGEICGKKCTRSAGSSSSIIPAVVEAKEHVTLVFEIDDTGPGIPPHKRNLIFENFQQADVATSRTHGGTGLGLGIVRALVRLMGGEISVADKEGPGTCFRFELVFEKVGDASTWKNAIVTPKFLMPKLSSIERGQVLLAMVKDSAGAAIAADWMGHRGLQVLRVSEWSKILPAVSTMLLRQHAGRTGYAGLIPMSSPLEFATGNVPLAAGFKNLGLGRSSSYHPFTSQVPASDMGGGGRRGGRLNSPLSSEAGDSDHEGEGPGLMLALVDIALIPDIPQFLGEDLHMFRARLQLSGVVVAWLVEHNTPADVRRVLRRSGCAVATKPLYASRMAPLLALATAFRGGDTVGPANGSDSERDSFTPENSVISAVTIAARLVAPAIPYSSMVEFPDPVDEEDERERVLWEEEERRARASIDSPAVALAPAYQQASPAGQMSPTSFMHVVSLDGTARSPVVDSMDPATCGGREPLEAGLSLEASVQVGRSRPSRPPPKGQTRARDERSEEAGLAGVHVLIAEDTPLLKKVAVITMRKLGCTVEAVSDGQEAVDAVLAMYKAMDEGHDVPKPFNAVLMDCQMPKMDGYSATAAIRAAEASTARHLPIVALTAHAMTSDQHKCLDAGMDGYLTKPIDPALMTSTLLKLMHPLPEGSFPP